MSGTTDINTTKTKLHRLLQDATPKAENSPQKQARIIPALFIICLLGTMLPFQAVVTFFSLGTVTIAILSFILLWKNQLHINKYIATLLAALTVTSVLSGCSPAFTFQTPPELIRIAHENHYQIYTMKKIGVFGLGLDQATVEAAHAESAIKDIKAIQIDKGHGLVSIVTITIAGEV